MAINTMGDRLKDAREKAGYTSARKAAVRNGWTISTYAAHENGQNDFGEEDAKEYAKSFGTSAGWLITGEGSRERPKRISASVKLTVPLVGYVAAGTGGPVAHFTADGELGEVNAPDNSTDTTVAVEIRGESLGSFFDRWLVFYDDVRRPLTQDLLESLCVIGLEDGRVLVKKPKKSKVRGLYHLLSQNEEPILDVAIEWAAKVKSLAPK